MQRTLDSPATQDKLPIRGRVFGSGVASPRGSDHAISHQLTASPATRKVGLNRRASRTVFNYGLRRASAMGVRLGFRVFRGSLWKPIPAGCFDVLNH